MKKTTLILSIVFAFMYTSCTNREVVITEAQIPDDIFYLKDEIKPYSGKCLIYFINSEMVKEVMFYRDGYLHGKRNSFYKNGQVKLEGEYDMGKYNGTWKRYSSNGRLQFVAKYQNDSLVDFIDYNPDESSKTMMPHLHVQRTKKQIAQNTY